MSRGIGISRGIVNLNINFTWPIFLACSECYMSTVHVTSYHVVSSTYNLDAVYEALSTTCLDFIIKNLI